MKLLAISPHLDDVTFSLAQTIAGQPDVTVLTVFAGVPDDDGHLTAYDQMCGFATSADAVRGRRIENERACTVLGADHIEGPWLDGQYGQPFHGVAVQAWLITLLADFDAVVIPVGIGHPDHQRVAGVAQAAAATVDIRTGVYLECPWYVRHPRDSIHALDAIADRWPLTPAELPVGSRDTKQAAVECFASQLGPDMRAHVYVPEHVWWLER